MLNMFNCIGRLVKEPTLEEKDGKKVNYITIAIPRKYKNVDGIYETDFIDIIIYNIAAENVVEYCKKGNLVAVKGRLQSDIVDDEKVINLIAENISFLSSK